ncbi:hypothetical protein CPSG_03078 [Coccidioides posadasii str. Silveira]|uniref:Uncharacterized protein n=1 Tax=Coccidioides posadasii (strain RMSCC 757 / Silveira) TaxID=443226 RepID=E9D0P9_COCPS|nr:hypothetical protein CPSG_03078 [Coccidioides posadasii str. Silveira]
MHSQIEVEYYNISLRVFWFFDRLECLKTPWAPFPDSRRLKKAYKPGFQEARICKVECIAWTSVLSTMFTHKQEQKIKCCPVKDATMRDFLAYTRENFCASSIAVVRLFAVAKNGTSLANIHD